MSSKTFGNFPTVIILSEPQRDGKVFFFFINSLLNKVDMGQLGESDISLEFYCSVAAYFGICHNSNLWKLD